MPGAHVASDETSDMNSSQDERGQLAYGTGDRGKVGNFATQSLRAH